MKKRLISFKTIEKAYTKEETNSDIDVKVESIEERIDKLPKEMFQILGEIVSFIENTNKIEGDKNHENK